MSRTTSRWTRTYDDAGRVSRLVSPDGHLTVHVSYTPDNRRWYYPARLPTSRPYAHLADAVSAEARAYNEAMALARDADLDLARAAKAREREAATESTRAAERMARAERRTALRWAAGLTVVGVVALVVCAGVVGVAL